MNGEIKIVNIDYFFNKIFESLKKSFEIGKDVYGWLTSSNFKLISVAVSLALLLLIIVVSNKIFRIWRREARSLAKFLTVEEVAKERTIRWQEIKKMLGSENSSDWKMAVIRADSLVNDLMGNIGYEGKNLGERLKAIEFHDFENLKNVWEAHQTRNKIVSNWETYELAKDEAQASIKKYEKALKELKYI